MSLIPYGKQTIDNDDIHAMLQVLNENTMLTTGQYVPQFEKDVCTYVGCRHAVAVNSGTAALHVAVHAAGITEGDEVIVPAISFVATANCILYEKGKPVFCDIDPDTLCIDVHKIEPLITEKTKAIIFVDMCGHPCDYDKLREIANKYNLILIQDASHSLGGTYKGQKVGSYADITCFSFHPVKNITTCEGGMTVTNNESYYKKALMFRSHGINRDFKERATLNTYYYEMVDLGYNYRIPDVLCAMGSEQLKKLDIFVNRRNHIANIYNLFFSQYTDKVQVIKPYTDTMSTYHIYVVKVKNRDELYTKLKEKGILCNVHYLPIYLHPYYQNLGYSKGLCPVAESVYNNILTIPLYPLLTDEQVHFICNTIIEYV